MSASKSLMSRTQPWHPSPPDINNKSIPQLLNHQYTTLLWILFLIQFSTASNSPILKRRPDGKDIRIGRTTFPRISIEPLHRNNTPHELDNTNRHLYRPLTRPIMGKNKRGKPATPTRGKTGEPEVYSPPKTQNKKTFTGEQAMDEEKNSKLPKTVSARKEQTIVPLKRLPSRKESQSRRLQARRLNPKQGRQL